MIESVNNHYGATVEPYYNVGSNIFYIDLHLYKNNSFLSLDEPSASSHESSYWSQLNSQPADWNVIVTVCISQMIY